MTHAMVARTTLTVPNIGIIAKLSQNKQVFTYVVVSD